MRKYPLARVQLPPPVALHRARRMSGELATGRLAESLRPARPTALARLEEQTGRAEQQARRGILELP